MNQSVMYSGRGRGRGRRRDFGGGRGSFSVGRNVPGGRLNVSDKGSRHCGRNIHISEKCWTKFGRPKWAQLADSEPHAPCDTPQTPSTIPGSSGSSTVILPHEEYDRLCQLEFSQNSHSATHASSQVCMFILPLLKSPRF